METATLCAIIGDADDELVSRYGIGKETLRTHRQRVIDKVGCGSQLGLCVRVFSAALGLADSR
jgi:DNA-binding CsgD family transcriptional regulator